MLFGLTCVGPRNHVLGEGATLGVAPHWNAFDCVSSKCCKRSIVEFMHGATDSSAGDGASTAMSGFRMDSPAAGMTSVGQRGPSSKFFDRLLLLTTTATLWQTVTTVLLFPFSFFHFLVAGWSGWVWVGECFFWYWPTPVDMDNKRLCVCVLVVVPCGRFSWLMAAFQHMLK